MPPTLSVIVLTRNEEENIEACLRSAGDAADETVVVDSLSTDRTAEIAERLGARVLKNPFENYSRQRNWALEEVSSEWVFFLDADERLTPALVEEIRRTLHESPAYDGYWVRRINYFREKRIRWGGWGNDRVLRLFRRTHARYREKGVHEKVVVDGSVGMMQHPIHHYTFASMAHEAGKAQRYSALGAEDAFRMGKRSSALKILFYPLHAFLKSYLLRAGFLEGTAGVVIAWLAAYSTFLKYVKLWERQRQKRT